MNIDPAPTLDARRDALRGRLARQRLVIAHLLTPTTAAERGYPRSATVRLLTGRPVLIGAVLAGLASLVIGGRLSMVLTAASALISALGRIKPPPQA